MLEYHILDVALQKFCTGGEKCWGKGRERSFQIIQHPVGFIGSADDIIACTEHCVYDNSQVFGGGNFWDCLGVGWVLRREGVSDKFWELLVGSCSPFVGLWY